MTRFPHYHRRTTYASPSIAQQIHRMAVQSQKPVSELLRDLIAIGMNQVQESEPPGPQTQMMLVYLRPDEDRLVRALAHRHHWTIAATLRRLIAVGLETEDRDRE